MTALATPIVKVPVVVHEETGAVIYALQPRQYEVFRLTPVYRHPYFGGPTQIGCGGSAGGGKSYLGRSLAAAVALAWPGSTSITFRGTEKEIESNHVLKFRSEVPEEIDGVPLYKYNGDKMVTIWANGSRSYYGFLKTDKDVFTYLGAEYDFMDFDESTTYTEFQVGYLTGNRLRATVEGSRPFVLYPSNPGNRGHLWYKRLFIERRYHPGERPSDYAFVQMWLADNQELVQRDPEYILRLNRLPEPWRSWQRDGNWAAGAGAAFADLNYDRHVIRPFEVPAHWTRFGAFDWGYNHPWSFGEYAVNEDGRMFCVETLRGQHDADAAIALKIREHLGPRVNVLRGIYAGHDCWSQERAHGGVPGPTVAETFGAYQLFLVQADIARGAGYRQVRTRLQGPPPFEVPNLVWFDTARNRETVACLERMITDPKNPEDVYKVDADEFGENGDDDYDQTRYACMGRPVSAQSGAGPATSIWTPEALATEHEKLYRRRPDIRTRKIEVPPAFGEDYE